VAKHAWEQLDMPLVLHRLGFNPAQAQVAAASVINRLADPVSENALPETGGRASLPDLMPGVETAKKDRY